MAGTLFGHESTMVIPLSQGKVSEIDDADWDLVKQYRWYAQKHTDGNNWYAISTDSKRIKMHRLILGLPAKVPLVDHKDRNGLNNRRENLRICTPKQNRGNALKSKNNTSGFKGVVLNTTEKRTKPWMAYMKQDNKSKTLGYFLTAEEAARAYDRAAVTHFGEFARLNFPL